MTLLAVSREQASGSPVIPGIQFSLPRLRAQTRKSRLLSVPLEDLRPTQLTVGMRAVAAKKEKVERRARSFRKLRRFLEDRPIPAIRGPNDDLFIIDHHHLSLALLKSDVEEAFINVVGDLSHLPRKRFLQKMAGMGLLHAYDGDGRAVSPTKLPQSLEELRCDPYRDLAWSVREAGGFAKTGKPYAEFRWADFFRTRIPRSTVRRDFDYAHDRAMWLARSTDAARMPGYISR
jgi:hypothetical protein